MQRPGRISTRHVSVWDAYLTGNCFRPFCTETVHRHRGMPVFFSGLSKAHTLSSGSLGNSSARVTSSEVFGRATM